MNYGSVLQYGDDIMNNGTIFFSTRKLFFNLILILGSFLTPPAFAWPEVDHMNMCGAATKVARTYSGDFKGWSAHDTFVGYREKAGYYYRNNCPETVAPVKKKIKTYKRKIDKKSANSTQKVKVAKKVINAKSSKVKAFKRIVKYDKYADCARVDKLNTSGSVVRLKKRAVYRLAN